MTRPGANKGPPPLAVDLGEWVERAACGDSDPDLWFSYVPATKRQAQAICWSCPVRRQCDEWANENRIRYGIWGGKDREI